MNGIIGGYTGEGAKTVIAGAGVSTSVVPSRGRQDPEKIRKAFRAFVEARLPAGLHGSFLAIRATRRSNCRSSPELAKIARRR